MKKTITHLLLIIGLASTQNLDAQNPILTIPNQYYQLVPQFSASLPTVAGGYNGIASNSPHNMYPNAQGKPLIFEANGELYNNNGFKIATLNYDVNSIAYSHTESIIVPDPGNCSRFYYIGSAAQDGVSLYFPVFSLIDMSQQTPGAPIGEKGKVLTTNNSGGNVKNLYDSDITPDYGTTIPRPILGNVFIAVTKPRTFDGNSRLLFVYNSYKIYIYKITTTGIQFFKMDEFSSIASNNYSGTNNLINGELEIYEDVANNKIKMAIPAATTSASNPSSYNLVFLDYNTTTNNYTNYKTICVSGPPCVPSNTNGESYKTINGVEFSANGNYVYFTHDQIMGNGIYAEWVEYNNITNRHAISPSGVSMSDFKYSQIELGLDGKMYFATSNRLAVISNSNNPSTTITYPYNSAVYSWNNSAVTLTSYPLLLSYIPNGPTVYYYALPDQVDQDTYGGFYNATTTCCNLYTQFNINKDFIMPAGTYTVTNGSVINGTDSQSNSMQVSFNTLTSTKGNITIPTGSKVTFRGLTIQFAPGTGMIVNDAATGQQGGKVVLNASTLTWYTGCGEYQLWNGVTLKGSSLVTQGTTTNSQHAVLTTVGVSQIDHALVALNIKGGAIVQFTGGSKLLDNKIAIEAETYASPSNPVNDVGVFSNVIIKTQSTFNSVQPSYFARITGRKPTFRFIGCTFDNDQLLYNNLYDGIISNDSKISATSSTIFNDLRYGINHSNTLANSGYSLDVNGGAFNRNLRGISVSNSNYASIRYANFNMLDNSSLYAFSLGLYLDNSSKFMVTNNTFKNETLVNASLNGGGTIGIVANNTNKQDNNINIIKLNTFYNLQEGIQCLNKNYYTNAGNPDNDRGLRMYCNTFNQSIAWCDIGVHAPSGADPSAIDYHQGVVPDSAAANIFSHTTSIDYFHYTPTTFAVDYKWHIGTTNGLPNVPSVYPVTPQQLTTNSNTCGAGGGGTGQRITGIETPETMLLKIQTLNQMLLDINSNSANKTISGTNDNSEIESNLQGQLDWYETQLVVYYLNDTTVLNPIDSAYKYIKYFCNNEINKVEQLDVELANGSSKEANILYQQIINENHSAEYKNIYGILLSLSGKDKSSELLQNEILVNQLFGIANNTSDLAAKAIAQNLLSFIGHKNYEEEIQIFNSPSTERKISEISESFSTVYKLSNLPNPFTGNTTITAFVPKGSLNAKIVITDILGKEIAKYTLTEGNNSIVFDKQDIKGMLYYSLFIDDIRKESKLMIKQ